MSYRLLYVCIQVALLSNFYFFEMTSMAFQITYSVGCILAYYVPLKIAGKDQSKFAAYRFYMTIEEIQIATILGFAFWKADSIKEVLLRAVLPISVRLCGLIYMYLSRRGKQ